MVEAIILSRKDFGEADRLISAFSRESGKIRILAKGSRKLKSKMAAHIEPFSVGKYFLAQGKSFYILAGAESISQNQENLNDFNVYKCASHICELLEITTVEDQRNEILYNAAKFVIKNLSRLDGEKRETLIRYFEFLLLKSSGYSPNYHQCKKCHGTLAEKEIYGGDFEGLYCESCATQGRQVSKNLVKLLRVFDTAEVETIPKIKAGQELNEELSEVISDYLYDILPRTPKSEKL